MTHRRSAGQPPRPARLFAQRPPRSHFSLNTSQLDPARAVQVITEHAAQLRLPVADPFRPGAEFD